MIQLRVRTEFSFKNVFGPINVVAQSLRGCKAAAIVDTDTWGHVKWANACKAAGIIPLFGCELVVTQPDGRKPTCWVLATDTRALYRLSSAARVEGANVEALMREAKGVIRFAGAALTDPTTFDYVDINPGSRLAQLSAIQLSKSTGKPLVVTSDNYYALPEHRGAFLAIGGRERNTPQHIIQSEKELAAAIPVLTAAQLKKAIALSSVIAKRCATTLPTAPLIKVEGDLRKVAEAGRKSRLKRKHLTSWPKAYAARLERELIAIEEKEYQSYFLVVADLVAWAKTKMLVGPARGSSAGSLLCYLAGITEVDPIPHGLLFERFIDLTRKDLPDIDIDFNDNKRELLFPYLADKYGARNVARIGNINTLKPRSLLASVFSRLGIPDHERFDLINVLIEYSSGDSRYGKGIEDTLQNTDIGRRFAMKYPEAAVITAIENHASHTGVHAAGIIVSMEPVDEYCTVVDGIAHVDKPDAEALNLLKIDALGLRTLGVIEDAGVVTADELYALKLDDPKVIKVFNDKKFSSVFQFEGNSQRMVTAQVNVDSFKTLDHITALARPGPLGGGASGKYIARKAGTERVTTTHPMLDEVLKDTFGVVLYQEQVMRIVREIGKFSWEDTTVIRKAMSGRKGKEFFDQKGELFVKGAAQSGIKKSTAIEIWNEICTFGAWGMNACAHKDTRIKLCHPNQFDGAEPTIEHLYKRYKVNATPWMRQRDAMPVLLALGADGRARPTKAVDIVRSGSRPCVRLTFEDGREIECTADHRFIINGDWQRCGEAKPGAEFASTERDRSSTSRAILSKGKGWSKGKRWNDGQRPELNGKSREAEAFRERMKGILCLEPGCRKLGKQVHHKDLCGGKERPKDLDWLCDGHHKQRHIDQGDRAPPYARGHRLTTPAVLKSIKRIGSHETYDIVMPDPHHNFVLANGIVTHNSHTCSYAIISYWCAWMKAYHPLEYAAACLRGAKDDDGRLAVLREMAKEGVVYVPFDEKKSQLDWSVQGKKLVGGFLNFHGVGPAKAAALIKQRDEGKKLDLAKHKLKFADLYPLRTAYADLYDQHSALTSNQFPDEGKVVYIGRIFEKRPLDANETVRVARRGGKVFTGNTLFIDFRTRDDVGEVIMCRVDRFNWTNFGQPANEALNVGDDIIVRGRRVKGFAMLNVIRIKCLNKPGLEWAVKPRW